MSRIKLGSWTCPSRNGVDVFLDGEDPLRHLEFEWDRYPLSPRDERFYTLVILPKVARLAQEYLETPGPVLVVRV